MTMIGSAKPARAVAVIVGVALMAAGIAIWRFVPMLDVRLHALLLLDRRSPDLFWLLKLTDLGGAAGMIPLALIGCVWLAWRRQVVRAAWLFGTIALGRALVEAAKIAIGRVRPPVTEQLASVTTLSFPSSHSAGAMLTCVALCLAFAVGRAGWALAIGFALTIGATRVLLGVHWPSDVLAGWGFGLAWGFAWSALLPPRRFPATTA